MINVRVVWMASLLAASVCLAEDAEKVDRPAIEKQLDSSLLAPMRRNETKKHRLPSREAPVPTARRVRVTQEVAATDAAHRPFVTFAIDNRYGSDWEKGEIEGCFYLDTQEAFVDYGEGEVYPAKILLGKMTSQAPGRCRAEKAVTARK